MDQFSECENKGQYCQVVKAADGSYTLQPVAVPAHIIAERRERIRKQKIRRQVKKNRERAQAINGWSLLFMSLALSIFVLICCAFIYVQFQMTDRLEQITEDNDTLENRLMNSRQLDVITAVATQKLGMRRVKLEQIRHYESDRPDYMLQLQDISDSDN